MASTDVNVLPAEIVFAQRLAGNEPRIRRLALKQLKKFIVSKSNRGNGGFTGDDLLKLWKGLHYCMWMQDKPLLQEELATNISSLVHTFTSVDTSMLFLKTFFDTQCREWNTLDKWRVDKFMMLFRRMLHQSLCLLQNNSWDTSLVSQFLKVLQGRMICEKATIDGGKEAAAPAPEGIRYHLADIYLEELAKVGSEELSAEQTMIFLEPWINAVTQLRNKQLLNHVIKRIFGQIIIESDVSNEADSECSPNSCDDSEEEGDIQTPVLKVDYGKVSEALFSQASSRHCLSRNRTALYDLVKKFKTLSEGDFPFEEEISSGSEDELTEKDVTNALKRLGKLENALSQEYSKKNERGGSKKNKKKKPSANVDSNNVDVDACDGKAEPHVEAEDGGSLTLPGQRKSSSRKTTKNCGSQARDSPLKAESNGVAGDGLSNSNSGSNVPDKKKKKKRSNCDGVRPVSLASPVAGLELLAADSIAVSKSQAAAAKTVECVSSVSAKLDSQAVAAKIANGSTANQVSGLPTEGKQKVSRKRTMVLPTVSDAEAQFSVEQMGNTAASITKKKKLGVDRATAALVKGEDSGDVEVWVPNKRYKGPLKDSFVMAQRKASGAKASTESGSAHAAGLRNKKQSFAEFDSGSATGTSSTFLKKAASKALAPSSKPKKENAKPSKASAVEENSKAKRVSFGVSKSIDDAALTFSPKEVFKPNVSPAQGIIKTRSSSKRAAAAKHQAKAADFF